MPSVSNTDDMLVSIFLEVAERVRHSPLEALLVGVYELKVEELGPPHVLSNQVGSTLSPGKQGQCVQGDAAESNIDRGIFHHELGLLGGRVAGLGLLGGRVAGLGLLGLQGNLGAVHCEDVVLSLQVGLDTFQLLPPIVLELFSTKIPIHNGLLLRPLGVSWRLGLIRCAVKHSLVVTRAVVCVDAAFACS